MLTPVITPEGILTLEGAAESSVERKMSVCGGNVFQPAVLSPANHGGLQPASVVFIRSSSQMGLSKPGLSTHISNPL
jgi:hypothetical protein